MAARAKGRVPLFLCGYFLITTLKPHTAVGIKRDFPQPFPLHLWKTATEIADKGGLREPIYERVTRLSLLKMHF